MSVTVQTTIVGVFENRSEAEEAVREMKAFGIQESRIGMVLRHANGREYVDPRPADAGTKAVEGAAVGAATGAGVGALWALGIAANILPAIGPVISGGILAAVLASAAGGAATAGLVGALVGLGISEEDAVYYEGELKSGRTLVTVQAPEYAADLYEIIHRHNGVTAHATALR
ncbi:hypothetical protein ETAA8_64800 [Anatilimnocola aggregata]|uniref:Uncharacterized protein n=1 Tax=Anatilimnocola aggregata TaxID=2528021 RepID=A0A517YM75_9BACT|nr:hypothetical protein [Anatilimnocola aggregata]QDU31327.1 hypothetical protein ETAA8_64800 [Anatilimnocola aggregata]